MSLRARARGTFSSVKEKGKKRQTPLSGRLGSVSASRVLPLSSFMVMEEVVVVSLSGLQRLIVCSTKRNGRLFQVDDWSRPTSCS